MKAGVFSSGSSLLLERGNGDGNAAASRLAQSNGRSQPQKRGAARGREKLLPGELDRDCFAVVFALQGPGHLHSQAALDRSNRLPFSPRCASKSRVPDPPPAAVEKARRLD